MNRAQVLIEYNDFLKSKFECYGHIFDADLLEFLEKTCVEVTDDESIDRLDLSIRARNALLRSGITTVSQLLPMSQTELMKIRNMGQKTLDEINEKVRQIRSRGMKDYELRVINEYRELKDRYIKLHKMIVRYDAKTLDFEPKCPIGILREQKSLMGQYLNILEVRAEIEGIGYDALQSDRAQADKGADE